MSETDINQITNPNSSNTGTTAPVARGEQKSTSNSSNTDTTAPVAQGEQKSTSITGLAMTTRQNEPMTVLVLAEEHGAKTCMNVQLDRIIQCVARVFWQYRPNLIPKRFITKRFKLGLKRSDKIMSYINESESGELQQFLQTRIRFMGENMTGHYMGCYQSLRNKYPKVFTEAMLKSSATTELDENSTALKKIIYCALFISARLIEPYNEDGRGLPQNQTMGTPDMCDICYSNGTCPDLAGIGKTSIFSPPFWGEKKHIQILKTVDGILENIKERLKIELADPVNYEQATRMFKIIFAGEKVDPGNSNFLDAFANLYKAWNELKVGGDNTVLDRIQYAAKILHDLSLVEMRNITWVKKMERLSLTKPYLEMPLLLIVPCGANHAQGLIREILGNKNLRLSNLSLSWKSLTVLPHGSYESVEAHHQTAVAVDQKTKLKQYLPLPKHHAAKKHTFEYIWDAEQNWKNNKGAKLDGLMGMPHQEPENPDKPHTRIGGKKKTRKKKTRKKKTRKRKTISNKKPKRRKTRKRKTSK